MQYDNYSGGKISRRGFLGFAAGAAITALTPINCFSATDAGRHEVRELSLLNTHTGEKIMKAPYFSGGDFDPQVLAEINHILRDHRTGEVKPIDPALLVLLDRICKSVESSGPVMVISGYRSLETNKKLAAKSSGVAKKSLHTLGKAMDIRIAGVDTYKLRQHALAIKGGGVGHYPDSGFVHIDTGRVRFW